MSALNVKNLVAPLLEKRNLVTIVLLALFFGVFRMSGGSVDTNNANANIAPGQTDKADSQLVVDQPGTDIAGDLEDFAPRSPINDIKRLHKQSKTGASRNRRAQWDEKRNAFNDMLEASKPKPVKNTNKGNQLDDIERALGLR